MVPEEVAEELVAVLAQYNGQKEAKEARLARAARTDENAGERDADAAEGSEDGRGAN